MNLSVDVIMWKVSFEKYIYVSLIKIKNLSIFINKLLIPICNS